MSVDLVVCVGVDTEAQRKSLSVEPTPGQAQTGIKASYAEESLTRKINIRGAVYFLNVLEKCHYGCPWGFQSQVTVSQDVLEAF